ncbi:MFS transporter [Bacillus paramycoides]|uniref:MFS transporter n=1 Tax=Bacillus paramycoides TaxID=2026194 RepID=UPI003D0648F3
MNNNLNLKMAIQDNEFKRREKKNIILFLIGKFISMFGSSIYNFAISFYILKETGSGLSFAISLALGTIPSILCGPISGVVSDKVDRKKMVILMDVLSGMVILGLFTVAMVDQLNVHYIYIATVLLAICNTFFETPLGASIPNMVDKNTLPKMNSWNDAVTSITTMSGPFLGGFIFAFVDMKIFLLINGLSFIFSSFLEMYIDFELNKPPYGSEKEFEDNNVEVKGFVAELKEGINYIFKENWIRVLISFYIFLNFFMTFGMAIPIPYIVNEVLKLSSIQFGIIETMFPFGILVGSIIFSVLRKKENNFIRMVRCFVIIDIGIFLLGMTVCTPMVTLNDTEYCTIISILFFIVSMSLPFITIPINTALQDLIPDEMRGRVFGLLGTMATLLIPVASILSGILLDSIPAYVLLIFSSCILFMLTFLMYKSEELRKI